MMARDAMHLLSAGAAKGLVEALSGDFTRETGATIDGTFGAVGAIKDKLLGGAPCDALILTESLLGELARDGHVDGSTIVPLGRVYTGIALRERDPDVAIEDADGLRASLLDATSVHVPDPAKATAGIHFASVVRRLGIGDVLATRVRAYPNGAVAMAALARADDARPMGCTQVTEILYTPGVRLVGKLPPAFELVTTYCAAVCTNAADLERARRFVALVAGPDSETLRRAGGFE